MEINVFLHRERGVKVFAQALRHIGDAVGQVLAVVLVCHVAAKHAHAACLDFAHPCDDGEQGGFAHAVRPN